MSTTHHMNVTDDEEERIEAERERAYCVRCRAAAEPAVAADADGATVLAWFDTHAELLFPVDIVLTCEDRRYWAKLLPVDEGDARWTCFFDGEAKGGGLPSVRHALIAAIDECRAFWLSQDCETW